MRQSESKWTRYGNGHEIHIPLSLACLPLSCLGRVSSCFSRGGIRIDHLCALHNITHTHTICRLFKLWFIILRFLSSLRKAQSVQKTVCLNFAEANEQITIMGRESEKGMGWDIDSWPNNKKIITTETARYLSVINHNSAKVVCFICTPSNIDLCARIEKLQRSYSPYRHLVSKNRWVSFTVISCARKHPVCQKD